MRLNQSVSRSFTVTKCCFYCSSYCRKTQGNCVSYPHLACLKRVIFKSTLQVPGPPDLDKGMPGSVSLEISAIFPRQLKPLMGPSAPEIIKKFNLASTKVSKSKLRRFWNLSWVSHLGSTQL